MSVYDDLYGDNTPEVEFEEEPTVDIPETGYTGGLPEEEKPGWLANLFGQGKDYVQDNPESVATGLSILGNLFNKPAPDVIAPIEKDNTNLYIGVAVGSLVVGGLVFLIIKNKN